jgi:hypothetical protein
MISAAESHCADALGRDLGDAVLSSAAVPRVGLWPTAPPLCRCAEYRTTLIRLTVAGADGDFQASFQTPTADDAGLDGVAKY